MINITEKVVVKSEIDVEKEKDDRKSITKRPSKLLRIQ